MVNNALESMVCKNHGEPTWEAVKAAAGIDIDVFISNRSYNDDITYQLVAAASKVLDAPASTLLEAFGEHWVLHTAVEGYGSLMQSAGKTLPEFLRNLPNLHSRVAMIFPELQPPHFHCTDITQTSIKLHYVSHRSGLEAFVVGLMHGLGKMFNTPVRVKQVEFRGNGADHDVFAIDYGVC
jgi:hypothetical protein